MSMQETLERIAEEAKKELETAGDTEHLQSIAKQYLGRKGKLTAVLRTIATLSDSQKRSLGKRANEVKRDMKRRFQELMTKLKEHEGVGQGNTPLHTLQGQSMPFDISLPGKARGRGSMHPSSRILGLVQATFLQMNFQLRSGPEVETDYYNFEALNFPKGHPSRDMHDSFFLTGGSLLRTHTSNTQIHVMEQENPPLRIISTGKCYRRDFDMSHVPMFHQFEGLVVDRQVNMTHLKNILMVAMSKIFEQKVDVRFRISYFPFVEPGAEFDVTCAVCGGKGCKICKNTGWVEIGGCGMVHPNVFQNIGYDIRMWRGFAFGFGIERIAMMKYRVPDIRLFFENDLRFLQQF